MTPTPRTRPARLFSFLASLFLLNALGWADSRVFVQYAPGAKGPVVAALAGAGGRLHYEFDHLNAVAVTLPEQALAGLSRSPNVVLIEEDPIRVISGQTTPYGIEMVQAPAAILAGATGAGIVVGVIDSGVFADHQDFVGLPLNGEPKGDKSVETTWNRDRDSHGTHVVGTIAAANNTTGVVGVAPGLTGIYMVKVFGDTGNWIYSSTLLTAVQRAVSSGGARIVSMSLGGGVQSSTERDGLQSIYNSGVLLIAAAGNGGNTKTSYPAGYPSVMSVAAVDQALALASFSQRNSTVEIAAPGVGVLSTVSYRNAALKVGTTDYIASALENTAQAAASGLLVDGGRAATAGVWAGKVVLVERGDNSFADKVANVKSGGGVAAIIYNNVAGGFSGTLGTTPSTIPAIALTREDGLALLEGSIGQNADVSTVAGVDVSGYDYFDGTSMATPHVSGVAALIWSKYPHAKNAQVRDALIKSARDLGVTGRDDSFGWGLVQAAAALTKLGELAGSGSGGGGGGGSTDTTGPVISNLKSVVTNAKNGSFTISWNTDEPARSSVTLSPGGVYSSSTFATTHTFSFRGTKGAQYTYSVTSTDAAGNTSTSGSFTHKN
jgi:serine protease